MNNIPLKIDEKLMCVSWLERKVALISMLLLTNAQERKKLIHQNDDGNDIKEEAIFLLLQESIIASPT
jgi:hypothetical protein